MADPTLLSALRDLSTAQQNASAQGATIAPEAMDAFLRRETNGKYGLNDVAGISFRNMGRSAFQGLTANFGDELVGMMPKFLGGGADAEDEMRLRGKLFQSQHPVANAVGEIAGALPTVALAPEAEGASLLGAVGRGALTGAEYGALSGLGAGETDAERLKGGASGAVMGGLLGGAIPGVAGAAKLAATPVTRAMSRVGYAIDREGGLPAVQAKLAQFVKGGRGNDVTLGDLGDRLRQEADFAANNSDDAFVKMQQLTGNRQSQASERLLGDVQDQVGNPQAPQIQSALEQGRRNFAAGPNGYGGLRDQNATFDTSDLTPRLSKPTVAQAWQQAKLAGDIQQGSPLDQLMQKLAKANPTASPTNIRKAATLAQPDLAAQDLSRPVTFDDMLSFKRALDDKVTSAYRGGNGNLADAYKTVRNEVLDSINQAVPGAQDVSAEYARRMRLEDALQQGIEAFHADDTRGLARTVQQLSADPQQLTLFRKGMASELISTLRKQSANRDVATAKIINRSPAMQDKLEQVFGNQQSFDAFMQNAQLESELAKLRGASGGSATHRRDMAAGFDPLELGLGFAIGGPHGLMAAGTHLALNHTKDVIARKTAAEVGNLVTAQGAPAIQKVLQDLVARSQQPLVGRAAGAIAPAMAPKVTGSLWDMMQQ